MAKDAHEYDNWYAALRGEKVDYPADQPPSGRWRTKGGDLVATWRDENGKILAWTSRAIHGHGQKLEGGHSIGETFSEAFSYPVPYKLWDEVKGGKPWPPWYKTRLTVKEATAGTMWTEALGRARAGQDVEPNATDMPAKSDYYKPAQTPLEMAQEPNPRAVAGDNSPPADLTPDQALAARVKKVASNFQDFLAKIGGKIKTKAEADVAANYATKFGDFKSLAEARHKVEKEPFLSKGREVDARWLPTARDAESHRAAVLKYAKVWSDAEKAAREEEARKANEIARQAAEAEARITGEPVKAIAEVKAEKVSIGTAKAITGRAKTIWQVTDSEAYFFYLRKTCPEAFKDVIAAMQKLANAQKSARVEPRPPGLTEKEQETLR